jgi:hypothetical protein
MFKCFCNMTYAKAPMLGLLQVQVRAPKLLLSSHLDAETSFQARWEMEPTLTEVHEGHCLTDSAKGL